MKPVSIKQQHEKDLAKFLAKYLRSTEAAARDVLRNFAKFTGKHLCQGLFFNKVAGRPATVLIRGSDIGFFP